MSKEIPSINPKNERLKREYLHHLKEARKRSPATVYGVRKAVNRYEAFTGNKDFSTFNKTLAVDFKEYLLTLKAERTGEPLSKSTVLSCLAAMQDFLRWLAYQPGYKSRIKLTDIDYLNLSEKETRAARSTRFGTWPTLEQIRTVIAAMPVSNDVERRNRALIAFAIVTGIRDSAMASLRLKHINLERGLVMQDPKEVRTKFSKRIDTFFFPVGDDLIEIIREWIVYLRQKKLYGPDDPLFPRTHLAQDEGYQFRVAGLQRDFWKNTEPVRRIYREAFETVNLPYFNPHSFRKTLVDLGQRICKTPEEYKAWSQNLGHEEVLTTFTNYGQISPDRQGEVIQRLGQADEKEDKLDAILRHLRGHKN